jgi:hypothetical protein
MHDVARVTIAEDVLEVSRKLGLDNKRRLDDAGVKAFNIMGAIGSGKTSLIEAAVSRLRDGYRLAAIAGDVIARFDAASSRTSSAKPRSASGRDGERRASASTSKWACGRWPSSLGSHSRRTDSRGTTGKGSRPMPSLGWKPWGV